MLSLGWVSGDERGFVIDSMTVFILNFGDMIFLSFYDLLSLSLILINKTYKNFNELSGIFICFILISIFIFSKCGLTL